MLQSRPSGARWQGWLPPPSERPTKKNAIPVGPHAVFGLTVALAYDALT